MSRTTTDMTLARDPELLDKLARVSVSNPGQTLRKAANVALGHTRESIAAILDYLISREVVVDHYFDCGQRIDRPKRYFPYGGGAVNNRLLDPDPLKRQRDPSQWGLPVCGVWQSEWKKQHPPGRPDAKRVTPSATPAAAQSLERSPEETARLVAQTDDREARYGATVDALTVEECRSLLTGNALYLAALARWSGSGPKPFILRTALKLAMEQRERL